MLSTAFLLFFLFQQPDEMQVVSNTQTCLSDENTCTYSGNAVFTYQDIRVESESITINRETNVATAPQHLRFTRTNEQIEGDNLVLDIKTKAGTMQNAFGHVGPGYYFTAADIRRYEDGRYELHNAVVTTCDKEKPGWSMQFKTAFVIPGESVTAGGSLFRLRGVPVFYFPYAVLPSVDRERSTGFLIPSTSTSTTKGRSLRESFYYAINRSADATFTGEYFSKRGPAGEARLRAVPNKNSLLDITAFFVHDKLGQGGHSERIVDYNDFGNGFRGVVDMNLVSSFIFRQVFEDGFAVISSPIEHSVAFVTRNQPNLSYNFLYNRTGIFYADQPTAVTRNLPAFEANVPEWQIGHLPAYVTLDGGLAGISRTDSAIKSNALIGRYDFHPVMQIPLVRSSAIDWSNQIGVRETFYSSTVPGAPQNSLNRFLAEYSTHFVGPEVERDFGSWRHVVEPTIDYRYVTGANRYRDTVVTDNVDLLTNTSEVEYGVTNRFYTTREIFSWRIAQEYFFDPTFGGAICDIHNPNPLCHGVRNQFAPLLDLTGFAFADSPRRFSPIVSTMRFASSTFSATDFQVDYDSEKHRFDGAGIAGGINRGQGFGSVAYFFRRSSPIQFPSNQFRGNLGYGNELKPGLSFAFSAAYDIQRRLFQQSIAQVGYNFDCYGLSLEWVQFKLGVRVESRIRFSFSLKNVGTFGNIRRQDRIF